MVLTRLEESFVFLSNQRGICGLHVQRQLHMELSQLHYNSRLYTKMAPGFVHVTSHENALYTAPPFCEFLATALESRPSGHPKKSPVWEYFLYDLFTDKSICQVEQLDSQSICGKSVAGKFPPNLKKQLKLAHPNVFQEIMRKDEESKKVKVEKESAKRAASLKYHHQSTLKKFLAKKNPYSKDSPRYKLITRKLAIFVGSSSVANRIVENLEFRDLLSAMDERKSRLAIRVLNYCRPHINAKRLNDVAHTLLWLATMYCSCCCVNCKCSAGSVNIIN